MGQCIGGVKHVSINHFIAQNVSNKPTNPTPSTKLRNGMGQALYEQGSRTLEWSFIWAIMVASAHHIPQIPVSCFVYKISSLSHAALQGQQAHLQQSIMSTSRWISTLTRNLVKKSSPTLSRQTFINLFDAMMNLGTQCFSSLMSLEHFICLCKSVIVQEPSHLTSSSSLHDCIQRLRNAHRQFSCLACWMIGI